MAETTLFPDIQERFHAYLRFRQFLEVKPSVPGFIQSVKLCFPKPHPLLFRDLAIFVSINKKYQLSGVVLSDGDVVLGLWNCCLLGAAIIRIPVVVSNTAMATITGTIFFWLNMSTSYIPRDRPSGSYSQLIWDRYKLRRRSQIAD